MSSENISRIIGELADYATKTNLIEKEDRAYAINRVLGTLGIESYEESERVTTRHLEDILCDICDYAAEHGIIPENTVTYRDLFDTKIMGCFLPRPSEVIAKFSSLYKQSPKEATDYFYKLSTDSDYIRTYRVKKDMKWKVTSKFGDIDITINLSKPEKDPKAIAAAKNAKQSGYPKCLLCHENEGFEGTLTKPARETLRQIPLTVNGITWYLQYSPYVYYNEHCILLSSEHTPMKIDRSTFVKMLDFIDYFPHYMIGSNADLPIVGGSILSHDHMQGGRYTFAMETAPDEIKLAFPGFDDISASIIHWPMSVIRLTSENRESLISLSDKILKKWRSYTDADAFVFAETDGEKHNTITPIARMKNGKYQIDLVLRNNITTKEHPLGLYHPHAELHNIKKENIGLIEVMGLAVLPSRLKNEMQTIADMVSNGNFNLADNESVAKHSAWFENFKNDYDFSDPDADTVMEILKKEVGKTFVRVLCDAGVYKCTEDGRAAFMRFINYVNN
ncbi:MAG: UDP-glucose--hexose-1-phosphate uridylyltransferase [Eubacteriales bacterium]|nr:UDP-glucose--hexose-1-phosphate uridylyltransferase [Eubacteriales bacterium]